jgi:MFS family permease
VLVDRTGRRPVLLGALLLFAGSGGAGALLGSLPALAASRAVLGLAAGGLGTAVTTLLVDRYDDAQRRVLGGQAALMALAALIYTLLGGALADLSWRAPFGLYLLGGVLLGPAAVLVPASRAEANETPSSAAEEGGTSWGVIALLYGLAFLGMAIFNLVRVELPYYLRTLGLTSGLWIGGVLSGGTVSGALASLAYDRVRGRLGPGGTLALVFGLFGGGFGVVAVAPGVPAVVGGLVLAGGGMGVLVPALNDGVGNAVAPSARGRVLGALSTVRNGGRFAAPLLTVPALVGPGATAPFGGAALLAGGLAAGLLLWAATTRSLPAPDAAAEAAGRRAR